MYIRIKNILILFLLTANFFLIGSQQLSAQENTENKAEELFENNSYKEALPLYKNLIKLDPLNEQINYRYGICLTETGNFSDETKKSLEKAKSKFPDAYLYLGKYYQANSQWEKAIENYNRFKDSAKKKEINKTNVNNLIIECYNKINKTTVVSSKKKKISEEPSQQFFDSNSSDSSDSLQNDMGNPEEISDPIINFPINAMITYFKVSQFKFDSSKKTFLKGWLIEQNIKSKLKQLQNLRDNYDNFTKLEKEKNGKRIMELENETYQMNLEVQKNYLEANRKEASYWNKAKKDEISILLEENRSIKDSLQLASQKKEAEIDVQVNSISQKIITEKEAAELAREEIKNESPKIVYKIQIGAFKNTPPQWVQKLYKRLSYIRRIDKYVDEKGITVYSVGELNNYKDALQMQKQIKIEGIKHAFVAAYKNGKRISMKEVETLTEK